MTTSTAFGCSRPTRTPLRGPFQSIGDAYTLNAPFTASDNVSITPEFGLLTNPDAVFTTDTSGFGDGNLSTFLGSSPLETGTLAVLAAIRADALRRAADGNLDGARQRRRGPRSDRCADHPGPRHPQLRRQLGQHTGDRAEFIDLLNNTIIPGINGALTTAVNATNTAIEAWQIPRY